VRAGDRRVAARHLHGGDAADAQLDRLVVLLEDLSHERRAPGSRELVLGQARVEPERAQRRGIRDVSILREVGVQERAVHALERIVPEGGGGLGDEMRRDAV
jgi:hypothetical protein